MTIRISKLILLTGLLALVSAQAYAQTRIVVLPYFAQDGIDASDGGLLKDYYYTLIGPIENELVEDGFEVVDPYAYEDIVREWQRQEDTARSSTSLSIVNVAKKYAVDLVYTVDFTIEVERDDKYKTFAIVRGRGYDNAGGNLGLNLDRSFKSSSSIRREAVQKVLKLAGRKLGDILTDDPVAHKHKSVINGTNSPRTSSPQQSGGALVDRVPSLSDRIIVRIYGISDPAEAETIGKIFNVVAGVEEAKIYGSQDDKYDPEASYFIWRLKVKDTEPFRLQTNILKIRDDLLAADGDMVYNGVPFRYNGDQLSLLRGLVVDGQTANSIIFRLDADRAEDSQLRGDFQ